MLIPLPRIVLCSECNGARMIRSGEILVPCLNCGETGKVLTLNWDDHLKYCKEFPHKTFDEEDGTIRCNCFLPTELMRYYTIEDFNGFIGQPFRRTLEHLRWKGREDAVVRLCISEGICYHCLLLEDLELGKDIPYVLVP